MRDIGLRKETLVSQGRKNTGVLAVHKRGEIHASLKPVVETHMEREPALRLDRRDTPRHPGRYGQDHASGAIFFGVRLRAQSSQSSLSSF